MSIRLTKIDKDTRYEQVGFKKYVKDVDVAEVNRSDFDGMLSLCIDARLAVTPIYNHFKTKEPVSTAGNALFPEIKSLNNFTEENVVVTHGLHPRENPSNQPNCGGHILAFNDDPNNVFKDLVTNLRPYVKNSFNNYDPFLTAENLARVWQAPEARFYDHSTGWLYDVKDLDNSLLGVAPSIFYEGIHPKIGQDPSLIIINTLGKPFFSISRGHKARKIGGVVEIFYPKPGLPGSIIESLVYCLQEHYLMKHPQSVQKEILEKGQFKSSETLLILANSTENLQTITKSILSADNTYHKKFIEGFFKDPKDIVIGLVPEVDNKLFEIKI